MDADRLRLSALWVVLLLNMLYADVVGYAHPGAFSYTVGWLLGLEGTGEILLLFSILIELPLAMVFLCLVLPRSLNRVANTAAAVLVILFVIVGSRTAMPFYFFAAAELVWVAAILWQVWRRPGAAPLAP